MVFFGDISIPPEQKITIEGWPFASEEVIANLEGCIITDTNNNSGVYNSDGTIEELKALNVKAVSLANNHIQDRSESFEYTLESLNNHNIQFFGASNKGTEKSLWKKVQLDGEQYYIISGAAYITGVTNKRNHRDLYAHVNEIEYERIFQALNDIFKYDESAKVICFFHWGCELELFPYPADREFAKKLIDAGVLAVIGCHSHCIQGIEVYNGAPIVYGLGNFLFFQGHYWSGKLIFPDISEQELGFEINKKGMRCHWFKYNRDDNRLVFDVSTDVYDMRVKAVTPFSGMSDDAYKKWFMQNRRKRKMLPIWYYDDGQHVIAIKRLILHFRECLISGLKTIGLKGGPH